MHSKFISTLSTLNFHPNTKPTYYTASSKPTATATATGPTDIEIRVCTNRTCRKQGSLQVLETLLGISPAHVSVKSCGCLGRCGSGPNLVVLPAAAFVSHCGTAARAAELMVHVCCGGADDSGDLARRCLDALALQKKGEVEFERKNYSQAEAFFSQAIEAKPIGGVHIAYKARSAARLALGNLNGALEDAREALASAPDYVQAYICQGDVFIAMNQLDAAEESYALALENDPSLRRSQKFKARIQHLQEKRASVAMS